LKSLPTPGTDLAEFTDHLSQAWGVGWGFPAAQYVAWSDSAGILSLLAKKRQANAQDICEATGLTEDGLDALLPLLVVFGLIKNGCDCYRLTALGEEYFLPGSPYYVGSGLFRGHDVPIPEAYVRSESGNPSADRPLTTSNPAQYFRSQMSRNLSAGVRAVRSGRFDGIKHLVDIGGGAGAISIPFAQDYPDARVSLVDLPQNAEVITGMLTDFGLAERIHFTAMDVFRADWAFQGVDGLLFGNFFHIFNDSTCRDLAAKCFNTLRHGGKVFVHELPFDEDRSGPMVAALWNANMRVIGGRQRTVRELMTLLEAAGFSDCKFTPTASRFQLIEAVKR
jgi:hypothetical protein